MGVYVHMIQMRKTHGEAYHPNSRQRDSARVSVVKTLGVDAKAKAGIFVRIRRRANAVHMAVQDCIQDHHIPTTTCIHTGASSCRLV